MNAPADIPQPQDAARFEIDAASEALIRWLRDYAEARLNSELMDQRRCVAPHVVLDFARRGIFGLAVPKTYGGSAMPLPQYARVLEQLAAIDLTLATFVGINNGLGTRPIVRHGTAHSRERWLPDLAQGRMLAGLALTEPGAGSNPKAIASYGQPTPGGWQLFGEKRWIGLGAWAGVLNVFVRLKTDRLADRSPDPSASEFAGFTVDSACSGVVQGSEAMTMGMRAIVQNTVHLRGVRVDKGQRLGADSSGVGALKDTLEHGRLGIAAICAGGIGRCAQLAYRYASRRQVSVGRLLDHPLTRYRLADMVDSASLVRALVHRVAAASEAEPSVDEAWFGACKVVGAELMWQAADTTMQMLGGRGYDEPNGVAQLLRDARLLRIFEGPTETIAVHLGTRAMMSAKSLQPLFVDQPVLWSRIAAAVDLAKETAAHAERRRDVVMRAAEPLGQLVSYALAAACTSLPSLALRYVGEAEAALRDALGVPARSIDVLGRQVEELSVSIGDIEQQMAGENHDADEWLRRDWADGPDRDS